MMLDSSERDIATPVAGPDALGAELEAALVEGLSEPEQSESPPASMEEPKPVGGHEPREVAAADSPLQQPETSIPALDADLEAALMEGLSDPEAEASDGSHASVILEGSNSVADPLETIDDLEAVADPVPFGVPGETAADVVPPHEPEAPVSALAFAMDQDTEAALRVGLRDYEAPSPRQEDPQVWPGGLRAAITALADGYSTRLILVDLDGISYPAGALHDLSAVCEVGTVVIAIGSNATAQASRSILLAGVSDYLVKPISAATVREAVARATAPAVEAPRGGHVVGFAGAGGSGTTTLAAATALHAAAHGRYVSVLDLNRTVSPMALMLDVEPAAGLDELLDLTDGSAPDPDLVHGVCAERPDRIGVYAYRSGVSPPALPRKESVDWLLARLRERSQLVLVDGADEPGLRLALLADADVRVLVAEPTARDAARVARLYGLLGEDPPVVLVQNHTRPFGRDAAARGLLEAGMDTKPGVMVPFEASLPRITDEGWPRGRLPRSLRKPLDALAGRILSPASALGPVHGETHRGP